jgi:ADP-heptose:LPS heptosyltransferase
MENIKLLGGLGDVLLHTPYFKKFFEKNKKKINCFVDKENEYDLLLNNPNINLFLIGDRKEDMLKIEKTSLNDVESSFFLKKFIKYGISLKEKHYSTMLPSLHYKEKAQNIIGQIFGMKNVNYYPEIFLTEEEIENGKKIISKYTGIVVCLNASSTIKIKEWDDYKWKKIIKLYPNVNFIQLGEKEEKHIEGALNFTNLKLREQLSILKSSNLYVGLDSFWNHAAKALNVKSVILFGPTPPKIWGHEGNVNIFKNKRCSPCIDWSISFCPYGKTCMKSIQVSDVKKAIDSLIQNY